jgi:hypothetical protein
MALLSEVVSAGALGDLLDRRRVIICSAVIIGLEILVFLFMVAGTHGLIVPLAKPTTTDFVSFYAAGTLADDGTPDLVYDADQHHAAEERATALGIEHNFFYYPPVFLAVCAALGHLPYLAAFVVFEVVTFALYLLTARRILWGSNWTALLPVLAFPPVFWNFGFGQNAFLTASLVGAGTLLVDRRPLLAGMLLGALSYKPQFAVLIPVALVAGRHWRALLGAFASSVALYAFSLALFGWETWHSFIVAVAASSSVYATGRIPFSGYINPFGAVRLLGGDQNTAYAVQSIAMLGAACLVAFSWRRRLPLPIRAAILASATLVAAPLALFYDLMLGAVAVIWLMHHDVKEYVSDWEKAALCALFFLSLSPRSMAESLHLPIGCGVVLALAAIVGARALRSTPFIFHPSVAELAAHTGKDGSITGRLV